MLYDVIGSSADSDHTRLNLLKLIVGKLSCEASRLPQHFY